MLKIGLTGGIGSGKSIVAAVFNVLGIPVFDADRQAKSIMEEDEQLMSSIQEAFGERSYISGKLNRGYIAKIVFSNTEKLNLLNSLVHPATIRAADHWMKQQCTPYVVKEAALMFESGSAANVDYVIGVHSPQHMRIKRVMDRDGLTREQVLLRISHQLDDTIRMKLCDFIIVNDEQQLLIPQILQLHNRFIKKIY